MWPEPSPQSRKHLSRIVQAVLGQGWGVQGKGPRWRQGEQSAWQDGGQVPPTQHREPGRGPWEALKESGAYSQPRRRKRRLTWLMMDLEDSTRLGEVGVNSLCVTAAKVRPGPAGQEG